MNSRMGIALKHKLRKLCVTYAYYMLMGAGGNGQAIEGDRSQCHRDILGITDKSEYGVSMSFVHHPDQIGFPKDYHIIMDVEGWERLSQSIGKTICERLWDQMNGEGNMGDI